MARENGSLQNGRYSNLIAEAHCGVFMTGPIYTVLSCDASILLRIVRKIENNPLSNHLTLCSGVHVSLL